MAEQMCLFVCGDVMTGRGIDQVLPHPGKPELFEAYVRDARDYVTLAEARYGRIPWPVRYDYIWGDALEELRRSGADVRIVNLETSITTSDTPWPAKGIHYRMNPQNIDCLTAAAIDCCSLANNHVLDWGYEGLAETIATLDKAGIPHAGAGLHADQAQSPAVLRVPGKGRVLVFSFGSLTSGIPAQWAATGTRPGVNLLPNLSQETARDIEAKVQIVKRPGDLVVASIHWGGNWGYEVPDDQIHFAHCLIDEGVDLVHGHSSHHAKAMEIYRNHPILYGCGDFLTDYEGIAGFEAFRGDLALMYLVTLDATQGRLVDLCLVPMQVRHFRLNHASPKDARWLCGALNREGARFDTPLHLNADNSMSVHFP